MSSHEAILIPGGGITDDGRPAEWVTARLDKAIDIHANCHIITLSGGTVHKPPPRDLRGFPIFEAVASAKYLIRSGVSEDKVLTEVMSYDTIGNAYFSRLLHVDPMKFRQLIIITSEFHMRRTETIFKWIYSLDVCDDPYLLRFVEVPNRGIGSRALQKRNEKEQKSLEQLTKIVSTIHSLRDLHTWLYTEHLAYSIAKEPVIVRGDVLDTY